MATLGSLVGSLALFLIARRGGEAYLARYTAKGRGAKLRSWFRHYGLLTVFVPALMPIPLPMKVPVLSAGALGVNPFWFTLVLMAARVPRYFLLAWMGTRLGPDTLPFIKSNMLLLILSAVALFAALFLLIRLADRYRARREAEEAGDSAADNADR
jgi:membrane protein DedA with SNARE-associated domain